MLTEHNPQTFSLSDTLSRNSYTLCNIIRYQKSSYLTDSQINAILSRSLKFTKLQDVTFHLPPPHKKDEVDQEILNAAGNVIPNIDICD